MQGKKRHEKREDKPLYQLKEEEEGEEAEEKGERGGKED